VQNLVSWECRAGSFKLRLDDSVVGTITRVAERGIKLAKGAKITVGEEFKGSLRSKHITIEADCLKVGKGPITLGVTSLSIDGVYLVVCWHAMNGFDDGPSSLQSGERRVKVAKVLETVDEVKWA
jgi:hypothetical protein